MPDYKSMYISLFNAITDAINLLQEPKQKTDVQSAIEILQKAQQNTEESYISN